jgi:hypothetical protein
METSREKSISGPAFRALLYAGGLMLVFGWLEYSTAWKFTLLGDLQATWPNLPAFRQWLRLNPNNPFNGTDAFAILLLAAGFTGLVWLELKQGGLSQLFEWMLATEKGAVAGLLVFTAFTARGVLANGPFPGDVSGSATWLVWDSLKHFTLPTYTNYNYGGSPFFLHYGPLFLYLSGALCVFTDNFEWTLKFTLFLFYAASAPAMYLAGRWLRIDRRMAWLAAAIYVMQPWRLKQTLIMGHQANLLLYILIPLAVAAGFRLAEEKEKIRWASINAIILAAIFYTHPVFARNTCLIWGGMLVLYLALTRKSPVRNLLFMGVTAGLFLVLAAGWLIPTLTENQYLCAKWFITGQASQAFASDAFQWVQPWRWLDWSNYRITLAGGFISSTHTRSQAYLGLAVILGFLALLWRLIRARVFFRDHRFVSVFAVFAALVLFIQFFGTVLPIKMLRFFTTQAPERWQVMVIIFLCLTLALAGQAWLELRPADWPRIFSLFFLVVWLDLGSAGILYYYQYFRIPESNSRLQPLLQQQAAAFPQDQIPNYRTVICHSWSYFSTLMHYSGSLPQMYGQCSPYGYWHEWAPLSAEYLTMGLTYFFYQAAEPKKRIMDRFSQDLSYITNVKYLAFASGKELQFSPESFLAAEDLKDGMTLTEVRWHSPVWVSSRLAPFAPLARPNRAWKYAFNPENGVEQEMIAMLDSMRLDYPANRARVIYYQGDSNLALPDSGVSVKLLSHQVFRKKEVLTLECPRECFGEFSISFWPALAVTLDGKPVAYYESGLHFVTLRLPAGTHTVSLTGGMTGRQAKTTSFSLTVLIILILWLSRGLFPALSRFREKIRLSVPEKL